jgi:hypothetical protein
MHEPDRQGYRLSCVAADDRYLDLCCLRECAAGECIVHRRAWRPRRYILARLFLPCLLAGVSVLKAQHSPKCCAGLFL